MKLFTEIGLIKKFSAYLLILNFLVITGLVSYHYHAVNFSTEYHETLQDKSTSGQNDNAYSYYTCPVIEYASSAFNTHFENNSVQLDLNCVQTLLPSNSNYSLHKFDLYYNLRAPPSFS